MNINKVSLLNSVKKYSLFLKSENLDENDLNHFLRLTRITSTNVDAIVEYLVKRVSNPLFIKPIGRYFGQFLIVIVTKLIYEQKIISSEQHRQNCITIAKLIDYNSELLKYTYDYFTKNVNPFIENGTLHEDKKQKTEIYPNSDKTDFLNACLKLLKTDYLFFRDVWNWSHFMEREWKAGTDEEKQISNEIVAYLINLNSNQLDTLNKEFSCADIIKHQIIYKEVPIDEVECEDEMIKWEFSNDRITVVENVFLQMFDIDGSRNVITSDIVKVDSTSRNLKNVALGISSGKAICLSGAVGSGKTTLVEYLAKITGRLISKPKAVTICVTNKFQMNGNANQKRKHNEVEKSKLTSNNKLDGFLKIQLGDQTDGKMLLGQYRCTDVPGEFVWQAGILTQAVINGSWILLEDLNLASQDVCSIISNLLENNFLSVPGFRDYIKIEPGFQIFFTLRTQKEAGHHISSQLLEKYLYTINLLPLGHDELVDIVKINYSNLTAIAGKIVDVFLKFSSGCHNNDGLVNSSLMSIPNSGRLVSTRDLLKLCKRSNPNFSLTSSECAYFVFQNAVDLFCSHLPSGDKKTELIVEIGAKLGIIESRCVSLANQYKPKVSDSNDAIKVGRVEVSKKCTEDDLDWSEIEFDVVPLKKRKIDHSLNKSCFSFTRVSSCLLERVAVSIEQNEPVLLVGETGVGKTSSIQYLSNQTNHKLVVINMNNQSDVSDLLGGYKPVDLYHVLLPIRNEFEHLFKQTFNAIKNEKFLSNISICFNRGDYEVLIKLMIRIVERLFLRTGKSIISSLKSKWSVLRTKLMKLHMQIEKKSINISFAFIPGSLVNCIKNGDWILLDEINLASSETLECLTSILEPDGSVILLEKGDLLPIKRHPDFRIFACMNPSTDIGKKDLPISIRNRFTEFFVDELIDENDITILVEDYLKTTGIQKTKVYSIVKLYKKLRELAYLKLNDGLGNRPIYSLRTLCRALCVCAKNLCGSIERNIYESVCLSFLTQLEPGSHKIVLDLIQTSLLTNTKAVLSQQLPQPLGEYINFEGYWIQKGNRDVSECLEYILTGSVKSNLKDLARIISIGKLPILLQGPTSAGKTSLIDYIAKKSGNYCLRINNHEHTDLQEYIGTYITNTDGKLFFQEGVLVQAMRNGYWIILDELNLAPSDILEALNRVLDDNRELFITETQTLVRAHPNFMLFATQNPPGIYGGRKTLSRAFKNRFIELHFSEIPKPELEIILEKRCLIPKSYAQKMVKTMSELQIHRKNTSGKNIFTLRDLFRWGNRYSFADKKLLENNSYDWNQHLVDEGYLVLSSKIRNTVELAVISDALFHNFRKNIDIDHLFTLGEMTSMVTKSILENLINHKSEKYSVVWTIEMRRIAVLVGKAIQFDEPILLIGPTGCGKTTICQIVAELLGKELRILNCHMHTEGADFLGGLRPYRGDSNEKFFEWHDGPLVMSMKEGSLFLADEISLAEDSVLERLNCILEPERTVLLSEKGGIEDSTKDDIIIKAASGFQFLATMNPGGDFGKKELSPALRNRFTEIWCRPTESRDELIIIVDNLLKFNADQFKNISKIIIDTVFYLKGSIEKFNFSIRDILAFANYIKNNIEMSDDITLEEYILYGLDTVFLDSLEMLPYESSAEIDEIKRKSRKFVKNKIKELNGIFIDAVEVQRHIEMTEYQFGIHPFYLELDGNVINDQIDFVFSAPTTKTNLFRLLSALSLNKSILLEGPPGVGKTTLIENIAKSIGYKIVRINLCEHTDLADLFGTDLPDDENILENENLKSNVGSFVWRDGPLLSALKSQNTWILLDELNLAPQSVLEGLNAILDHRGEVYIPELNKTFKLGNKSRIFAAQNPLKQGGGRKGLPQSFLNRFTKVYLKKLEKLDLLHVIQWKFGDNFTKLNEIIQNMDIPEKMVDFSEHLETGIRTYKFGLKGGPFETNLRDILRWCSFLFNNSTGLILYPNITYDDFVLVLFEKMKIVYYERMRCEEDKAFICSTFQEIFKVDAAQLNKTSNDTSLYWTNEKIYMNDIVLNKNENLILLQYSKESPVILESQVNVLKTVFEAHIMEQPIILSGATDCGKTKSIDLFCSILNRNCVVDSIDDSVTGSFQQIDYNRHLEEIAITVERTLLQIIHNTLANDKEIVKLFKLWENYRNTSKTSKLLQNEEVSIYRNRIFILEMITREIEQHGIDLGMIKKQLNTLLRILERTNSLNTGGRFEWIDSKVVKSIKNGEILCLEHVNLCSSAILDRLNSVLEPNGKMLISEKGVLANQESELIGKHHNFRIFLTLDPRNGEISRAMRNRCVEINFNRENYTENDLRKLIYNVGIHELFLINTIILIHSNLKSTIEFNNFGLSHILKFSFLVLQHLKLGDSTENSLRISSNEAYVISSTVDLMGFGLKFYRNKLSEIIEESLNNFKVFNNNCNFDNILIKSNQMTPIKLIKLQYEPYLTLLNGNNESLLNLSTNYDQVVHKLNHFKFNIDYLLNLLFNMSSNDVDLREIYLDKVIQDEHIKLLNSKLYLDIKKSGIELCDVPWNSTIFPRIRDYITNGTIDLQDRLKLSLTLLLRVILNVVQPDENMKLDHITVLSYSKAVKEKIITDSLNHVFINNMYEFLSGFENYLLQLIKTDFETMDLKSFIDLSCSFLWFNRLLNVSYNKLVINKNKLNDPIVSSLIQHFKWMTKHVFSKIKTNKIIDLLGGFISDKMHPLHKIRKVFQKTYTNFLPFYNAEQIAVFEKMIEFDKKVTDQSKFELLHLYSTKVNEFNWLRDLAAENINTVERIISVDISTKIEFFINNLANLSRKIPTTQTDDFDVKFQDLETRLKNTIEPIISTIDMAKEYFGIKGLNILRTGINKCFSINSIYYNNMRTMSMFVLHLINNTDSNEFNLCENLWSSMIIYIYNEFNRKEPSNIKDLLQVLPVDFYKNYSTFNKNLVKTIKSYELNSNLSKIDEIFCRTDKFDLVKSTIPINGRPILTEIIFEMLLNSTGNFKSVGLIEMNTIKCDLNELKNLMWNNILTAQKDISHERSNLCLTLSASVKLLLEIKDIVDNWENNSLDEEYIAYKENFIHLCTYLENTCKNIMTHLNKSLPVFDSTVRDTELRFSSTLYTLLGTLELNLLTYAPDLDPVERNNLKMAYILEDEHHIKNLLLSYDIQRVIMNYNALGEEVYDQLKTKLDELNTRKKKFSKKVALRHEDCKYNGLVRDITHFLQTCVHPKTIFTLVLKVSISLNWQLDANTNTIDSIDGHIKNTNEQVKMIETILKNILRFEKTLHKYLLYYRDFLNPIEYSLAILKFGLNGLINCLIKSRDVLHKNIITKQYFNINQDEKLNEIIENIIEYPKTNRDDLFSTDQSSSISIYRIIENLDKSKFMFMDLLKAKLHDLHNQIAVAQNIDDAQFEHMEQVYNSFNKIWQQQEELRKKRQEQEDSLYVTKTKCGPDDEELIKLNEIKEIFPNYAEEDFSEFVVSQTLEQVKPAAGGVFTKKLAIDEVIGEQNFEFICENFINLLMNYGSIYYHNTKPIKSNLDFISPFETRVTVFQKLFNEYQSILSTQIDDDFYPGFMILIGLSQQNYKDLELYKKPDIEYNFYKDSNMSEVTQCLEVLKEIDLRVLRELNVWPDHAVLLDLKKIIDKIYSIPANSSIVRFNTGFQILRQKIDEWNKYAHKGNNLKDQEITVAGFVQRWTKLELQFWRECLSQTYSLVRNKSYKYWFFIYNMIHEYLMKNPDRENKININFKDARNIEKIFDENEGLEEGVPNTDKELLKSSDIVSILKAFVENSNYADFSLRMKLMKSFEIYLNLLLKSRHNYSLKRIGTLIAIFHNISLFFEQFRIEIDDGLKKIRSPIEKKLKEFVKIESYTKDLSYFSMKNNILHVHKNLHKFLKEYENQLRIKVTTVFTYKSNLGGELSSDREEKGKSFRYEAKIKYYMIDVKNFMASNKLKEKYNIFTIEQTNLKYFPKLNNLFSTSRNIVKQIVLHASYPTLVYNLDTLLTEQMESCEYLKNLEVDRNQERPKQVSQAKNILSQKKKALSDLFKILSTLGISYKTGLLELNLNSEITNLRISPFCANEMLVKLNLNHKKNEPNLMYLSENTNSYYFKCIFKLKLLFNSLQQPNPEIGVDNGSRIKGFSVDMFILIQNQKIVLSESIKNLHELRLIVKDLSELNETIGSQTTGTINFVELTDKRNKLKTIFSEIKLVFEQFLLLLKTVPDSDGDNMNLHYSVIKGFSFNQKSGNFVKIEENSNNILEITNSQLNILNKLKKVKFINSNILSNAQLHLKNIKLLLLDMLSVFCAERNPISLLKSIRYLIDLINDIESSENSQNTKTHINNLDLYENEFDNIIYNILLPIQTIYKKYSKNSEKVIPIIPTDEKLNNLPEALNDSTEKFDNILDQHLKSEIVRSIETDLKILNCEHLVKKLHNLLKLVFEADNVDEAQKLCFIKKLISLVPLIEQYNLLGEYYVIQQLAAHNVSTKMLSILLSVFIELVTKGFCIPQDLMKDEDGDKSKDKNEGKGEGFGLEDGTGENDVSDRIENEDQLDDAKKPEDYNKEKENEENDCKEEKGIEMSEDFDSKLQDLEKDDKNDDSDSESNKSDDDDLDKEMDKTNEGAEKLDEQIWGDDENEEEDNDELNEEEDGGKGSNEKDDKHNDLGSQNEKENKDNTNEEENGLDAANSEDAPKERKEKEKEIDKINETEETGEEQPNPHHNELEEPPEAEDFDLDENLNVNDDDDGKEGNENETNPFDIDTMKDQMEPQEDEDGEQEDDKQEEDSDKQIKENEEKAEVPEFGTEEKHDDENKEEEQKEDDDKETDTQTPGNPEEDEDVDVKENSKPEEEEENKRKMDKDYHESKDKTSNEDNIQAKPDTDNANSTKDQTKLEDSAEKQQNDAMDEQDTGEDKDGIGQAENEISDSGHQGVTEQNKPAQSKKPKDQDDHKQKQRKQGSSEEERTLSEKNNEQNKRLKTIDKTDKNENNKETEEHDENSEEKESDEYQHVKEPNKTDKSTLDNATEEQSSKMQHEDKDAKTEENENEENDEIMDVDEEEHVEVKIEEIIDSEKLEMNDKKTKKQKQQNDKLKEQFEAGDENEEMIEGEATLSYNMQRPIETTAHTKIEIISDHSLMEASTLDDINMKKMVDTEKESSILKTTGYSEESSNFDLWQEITNKMQSNARELCEQLRLILEPTKCTRLKGDYRTGRRINMRKIIPYIASQFRKDKIWLRRTKPAKRDYKITIAIDDSKSMDHNQSKYLTLESISLVSQALTLLESGKLNVISFGEKPQIILNYHEQFNGLKLVNTLNFDQNQSRIAELLNFVRISNLDDGSSSGNGLFENLLLIISDGRNIFSEGEEKVKNSVKLARLQHIFIVYIIIDNPENKHSILDIRVPTFSTDKKTITMSSYLDSFPFPYYVIVRDLNQLPIVLSDAMRQWFELVNSEQ